MGMFSWVTSDTKESIANVSSSRPVKTVYLLQPNGQPPIKEECYDGDGDFGGVDAFVWVAEQNASLLGIDISKMGHEEKWALGIHLYYERETDLVYPLKFSFNPDASYEALPASKDCSFQGFFYNQE